MLANPNRVIDRSNTKIGIYYYLEFYMYVETSWGSFDISS